MKLGISTAAYFGRYETEEAAAYIRRFPVDTCEIFLQCPSEYREEFGQEVRSRLDGLHCTSVHPKGTQFEQDLFSLSPRQTADSLSMLRRVCTAAQAIGARYYVMHGAWGVRTRRTIGNIHELVQRMERIRSAAASCGIEVLWENVSWCALRTPEDVAEVRRLMPGQGFVLDIKQAREAGADPADMVRAMGPNLKHVHLLDHTPDGKNCLPGTGCFDFPAFFRLLRETGYDGSVILEPYEPQVRSDEEVRRSLCCLRECMDND